MYQSLNNNSDQHMTIDLEAGNACIICFELDGKDIINIKDIKSDIKKCNCSGSVHTKCLNNWYKKKRNIKCIMCNTLIARQMEIERPMPPPSPGFSPASCKLMVLVIIITTFIVIAVFYPHAFDTSVHSDDDGKEVEDPSYLQSIMVGQY